MKLKEIVKQLESCNFECEGGPLTLNVAFISLKAMAEMETKASEAESCCTALLSGVESLTNPNCHELNKHAGRNDRLLHAVLCAYAKHHLDCYDIGWSQLSDILHSAICNEIGDDAFCRWLDTMRKD